MGEIVVVGEGSLTLFSLRGRRPQLHAVVVLADQPPSDRSQKKTAPSGAVVLLRFGIGLIGRSWWRRARRRCLFAEGLQGDSRYASDGCPTRLDAGNLADTHTQVFGQLRLRAVAGEPGFPEIIGCHGVNNHFAPFLAPSLNAAHLTAAIASHQLSDAAKARAAALTSHLSASGLSARQAWPAF